MKDSKNALLPALLAVGTGFAIQPAAAIELGEINVQSTLGQPLRASIAYALGPHEQIANYCVTLKPGIANNGLPAVTRADISIANGVISLTGKTAVRDPLMTLRLDVACPYTPNLSREYLLFVDPAAPLRSVADVSAQETSPAAPAATATVDAAPRPVARPTAKHRAPQAPVTPIDAATRYRVQPGDSLSEIAARIDNRPVGLWDAVAQIFEANPGAFIDSDPNRLKAGSWLLIPDFASATESPVFDGAQRGASNVASSAPAAADGIAEAAPEFAANPAAEPSVSDSTTADAAAVAPVADALEPGSVAPVDENPFVEPPETNIVIPDTAIEAPASTSRSPNVPTATIVRPAAPPEQTGTNWLLWLVGGGIVLIAGLLAFGRRGRDLGDPATVAAEPSHPLRRASDSGTVEQLHSELDDDDFELSDDSPTEENLALDADLEVGTGLSEAADHDVRHDFAFAESTSLDLRFPLGDDGDTEETDMLPAPRAEEAAIVEREVLPQHEDYDMSVIVDATKMPDPSEVTERDLKAVAVENEDEDGYTLDQEIDFNMLEQDYEEELTATQALNKEIEKAAQELAMRLESGDDDTDDRTADLKLASVTELDVGTRRVVDNAIDDLEDTGVNEEITQEMLADDKTAEMPATGDEDTVEMPPKSRKA